MPNRIIKDSIHTSDSVAAMTDLQFRVWMALITYVDDYGRGDARPAIIKGACFPLIDRITPKAIKGAIDALVKLDCVRTYTVNGKAYLYLPAWEDHQRIRNKRSDFPAPPGTDENPTDDGDSDAEIDESPQVAASRRESPQDAARAGAESESESESNLNPNTKEKSARADAHTREGTPPPSQNEVEAYIREKRYKINAARFIAYYRKRGWQGVDDWREKLDEWNGNEIKDKSEPPKESSFDTDAFMLASLKRVYGDEGA